MSEFGLLVASIICPSAQPLAFPAPRCVDVSQNISKLQGLRLERAEIQWCKEDGLQFGGDVANPEAASPSWNVKFIQPSMQKQAETLLSILQLGCKGCGKDSCHGEHSWALVPKARLLSKADRRSMPVTVHRLPWATLRNQVKMDSV